MTTPLFMLRCCQIGIRVSELDLVTIGMVNDMYIEQSNDSETYPYKATQEDFDRAFH